MNTQPIKIGNFSLGQDQRLCVIAGPCVIESELEALKAAEFLMPLFQKKQIHFVYKSSYDKANRSSLHSFRGPGRKEGLRILKKVKETFHVPIMTDIHLPEEAEEVATVADILQIPAFLCRQTDLTVAAAKTGAIVNIKKGQFMAPWDMKHVVGKVVDSGNHQIIVTDRGTTFGYNNLVSDMRAIPIMKTFAPYVCFDAAHSTQLPGASGASSGGQREYIPVLSKCALAAGADLLYVETHPDPQKAKSDKDSQIPFQFLEEYLDQVSALYTFMQTPLMQSC